jgi:ubiquitin-activating enzyme E1
MEAPGMNDEEDIKNLVE